MLVVFSTESGCSLIEPSQEALMSKEKYIEVASLNFIEGFKLFQQGSNFENFNQAAAAAL